MKRFVVGSGYKLPEAFRLHWSCDEWRTINDVDSTSTALGVEFMDIPIGPTQKDPVRFTFFWTGSNRWEGCDYAVTVV